MERILSRKIKAKFIRTFVVYMFDAAVKPWYFSASTRTKPGIQDDGTKATAK